MLILIDGISGSGKTTLAAKLAELFDAQIIHMDDLYPGWQGLQEGSVLAEEIANGRAQTYQPWNWYLSKRDDPIPIDTARPLIIEGCGSITPQTAEAADLSIWIEASEELAVERVKMREHTSDPTWWEGWHSQELEHWQKNRPQDLANLTIRADSQ